MRNSSLFFVSETRSDVSSVGWMKAHQITQIDAALKDYDVVYAAAGQPYAAYPTSYAELLECTGAQPMVVGE